MAFSSSSSSVGADLIFHSILSGSLLAAAFDSVSGWIIDTPLHRRRVTFEADHRFCLPFFTAANFCGKISFHLAITIIIVEIARGHEVLLTV